MRLGVILLAITLLPLAPLFVPSAATASPTDDPEVPAILDAAETLFLTMKARDYPATWAVLTAKSRHTIVSETGGPIARQYWDGFLRRFNPDDALERSRWEMGEVKKDRAEVRITRRGSDNPAILQMYREDGVWKVGLAETFWAR
ncbi:MAG: putative cytosolic protein [Deltaproteobacteria bacterium]|nr:putative cytosolic protein [Deltaproteobacteria bacterium]